MNKRVILIAVLCAIVLPLLVLDRTKEYRNLELFGPIPNASNNGKTESTEDTENTENSHLEEMSQWYKQNYPSQPKRVDADRTYLLTRCLPDREVITQTYTLQAILESISTLSPLNKKAVNIGAATAQHFEYDPTYDAFGKANRITSYWFLFIFFPL